MDTAVEYKKEVATGQMGLFGAAVSTTTQATSDDYSYQLISDWSDKEKLEKEKEVIGFYLSAHPLESYKKLLRCLSIESFDQIHKKLNLDANAPETVVIGCGLIKSKREIITKKGDRMAFLALEDKASHAEVILFPSVFKKVESWLSSYQIFIVKGGLDITSTSKCKIKANECVPIDLFFTEWPGIQKLVCVLPASCSQELVEELKTMLTNGTVPLELVFQEQGKQLRLATRQKIAVSQDLIDLLHARSIAVRCVV